MNITDDQELLRHLNDAIDDAEAAMGGSDPARFAAGARRAARRRTTKRALGAGLPVLAAAGVSVALLSGSNGASTSGASVTLSAPTPVAPVQAHDTAYIVRHIRARLDSAPDGSVIRQIMPQSGGGRWTDWFYVDPQAGVQYQRSLITDASGAAQIENDIVATPINDVLHFRSIGIDYTDHTWTEGESVAAGPMSKGTDPSSVSIDSAPSQVQNALKSGQVAQRGTATIDGHDALRLKITPFQDATATSTLYVDSQTYQPLRFVESGPNATPITQDWMPATPDNIALTKTQGAIAPGFTQQPPNSSQG